MDLFDRLPGRQAATFAEATSLLDDGLDLDLVLELFAADAPWLGPLLRTEAGIVAAGERVQPSYYFAGALKQKFISAGVRRATAATAAPLALPARPARVAFAAAGLAAASAIAGVVTFGLLTAGKAEPGDWDYVFRASRDRFDDTLSRQGDPIEFRLRQGEARVTVITQLSSTDDPIDDATLDALQDEARELIKLAELTEFDDAQKEQVLQFEERAVAALTGVKPSANADPAKVEATIQVVQQAAAAATGIKPLPEPSPSASPTPGEGTPTATASETPSATPTQTAGASPSVAP